MSPLSWCPPALASSSPRDSSSHSVSGLSPSRATLWFLLNTVGEFNSSGILESPRSTDSCTYAIWSRERLSLHVQQRSWWISQNLRRHRGYHEGQGAIKTHSIFAPTNLCSLTVSPRWHCHGPPPPPTHPAPSTQAQLCIHTINHLGKLSCCHQKTTCLKLAFIKPTIVDLLVFFGAAFFSHGCCQTSADAGVFKVHEGLAGSSGTQIILNQRGWGFKRLFSAPNKGDSFVSFTNLFKCQTCPCFAIDEQPRPSSLILSTTKFMLQLRGLCKICRGGAGKQMAWFAFSFCCARRRTLDGVFEILRFVLQTAQVLL